MTVLRVIKGGDWKLRIGRKTDKGEVGEPSDLASNPSLSFSDWLKPRFSDTRSLLVREGTHYYMEKAISFSRSNHITCHLHLLWLVTPRFNASQQIFINWLYGGRFECRICERNVNDEIENFVDSSPLFSLGARKVICYSDKPPSHPMRSVNCHTFQKLSHTATKKKNDSIL